MMEQFINLCQSLLIRLEIPAADQVPCIFTRVNKQMKFTYYDINLKSGMKLSEVFAE